MKFRSTLLLLLLATGLSGYIWFYDAKQSNSWDAAEKARTVIPFDRETLKGIAIKNAEGDIILRKGDNDVWMLEKPLPDRADPQTVNALIESAEALRADEVLGEDKAIDKEQLKEFGLANAETKLTFSGGDKPIELLFGKDAAVEGKLYVKRADDKKVFVIANPLKAQISKKADQFRDRKLSELTAVQIQKVAIKTPAGDIELERKNDHWSILKPLTARGDDARIGDLIAQVTTARVNSFAADAANLAAYGLQEPRGSVSLYAEGSDKPAILQIGGNPAEAQDKTYAKLSTRDAVVVLHKTIETLLAIKPNDLRDKNLLRVPSDIVDRINLEGLGGEKIVLSRKGESWVRRVGGKEMPTNAALAMQLLTALSGQQVTGFEADVATDLPKYGLDHPAIKVTLSAYSSENTAETQAGEKPIVTVLFGRIEGDTVYAKLDDEPFIVTVPKYLLETIPTDPLRWQELSLFKLGPEEITSLEISRPGQPALFLEREKDKWQLAKGDGNLNQARAQALVKTLSSLRAVRWIGAAAPAQGLDQPTLTVRFKTSQNTSGQLTIGARAADETYFASADGYTGTFALSSRDEEILVAPLMDKPAALAPGPVQPDPTAAATPPLAVPAVSEAPGAPNP